MATLSLKISLDSGKVVKTMQFNPSTTVYDACHIIREKILEANMGEAKDYGLFLTSDEDTKKGIWLEPARSLDHYILRNGDVLEFNRKMRNLRVRMLDGSVKTLLVDDSQVVANLMVVICTKIGITNYDEYSLVREDPKDEQDSMEGKPNYGTLTLRRKNQEKERDVKMDQLRKKLRTDDEVNWVDPALTLREQGVDATETLLLRRKFFFSDRNVDSRDPVQLGLLYVQARDAIVDGTHPVTQDMACEFAGIQCQIQFGDHKDDKHIMGFLDTKEFLPASYAKVKGIEKKMFKEHKKHIGLSELDAKVLYTKNARSLPTYGVAFFLVKEKMKGKNKLVPRLLGVSKDSVLRLDEKTKDILQTWPLTTVRRWCGSPNTFTLDFGDYSDQYYSVQTTEAEQILQVIAGYIDIILKKQKAKDHLGIEGDEGSTMVEESVSPSKAQILQHESTKLSKATPESLALPAVVHPGGEGSKSFVVSQTSGALQTTTSGQITIGHTPPATNQGTQVRTTSVLSEPQRALLSTISSGREIIRETESHLTRATLPVELGHDAASIRWKEVQLDTNKQVVTSQIAAMNAATAQVVTLTSGPTEEVDHTAVGAAITTITSNLPEMTKGVQMIAALMEDEDGGDRLLDATRRLCTAFSDLLKAAEPEAKETRQNLLNAASRVGEASTNVLYTIGEETEENKEIQDTLLALAKAVANTTAALVLKAKGAAAACRDEPRAQARVIAAATQCALATSQLVACAKVVAPTLQSSACREQLAAAARAVALAVEALLAECRAAGADSPELTAAAAEVTAALRDMLDHVDFDRRTHPTTVQETSLESVITATDRLITSQGDSVEMVRQARLLGHATAELITNIKTEAEQSPQSDQQRRLLAAAKLLADATARMVEAARQCSSAPQDRTKQEALVKAAEELRYITVDYAQGQDLAETQVARLQDAARRATSAATQLLTSAQNAAAYNTNKHSQESLLQECRILSECMPQLAEGVKVSSARPGQASAQLELITASETFLQPSGLVAQAARSVLPTVSDAASAKQLGDTTHQFTASCAELRSAVNRARISCKGVELDAAAEVIRSLQRELDEVEEAARAFQLKPLPGETADWASQTLSSASRNAASSVAQVVSSLRHGDAAGGGRACADTAHSLREFVGGVRAAAAANSEPASRERVIDSGRQVLASSLLLVETAKRYLTTSERIDTTTIVSIAKSISQSLEQTVEAVPSHKELDIAMENINETLNVLNMGEFPPSDRTYGELQQELNSAAAGLNSASSEVVQTVDKPAALADSGRGFGDAFDRLLGVSMEMAGQTEDHETRSQMLSSMRGVTVSSSRLLGTAKSVSQDLTQPNARNRLAAAARAVTDSINNLVDVCTSGAPGQKECDKAVRSIQSTRPLLQGPTQPVNDLGYFGCLDAIVDQSKTLSEGMSGMANSAKRSDHEQFSRSVRAVAEAICGLVECTAQSAYLVAVSDETSVAGRAGLIDQAQFARAAHSIEQACEALADPASNQQQVLSAATVIAKHTSALCNACRVASGKTPNAQAKRHFVQAAKDVANSTAALVKEIKALDSDYSEANRERCAQATGPLLDAVHSLCQFANSPEFASVPAKISPQARRSQEAILESGRMIIKGSCSMVESAKVLAVQPTDKPQWQSLATHSKTVSDSIKSLVNNIRDKAPGQRECLAALETLNSQLRELDRASLQAVQQNFAPRKGNTLQGYSEQIENSASEMVERLEPLRSAARSEAENLGHAVVQLVSYVEPIVAAGIGAASNITESAPQMSLLEQCKTVVEGVTQLVLASKDAGGNPRATSAHPDVDEQARNCRETLGELTASVRRLCTEQGLVGGLLDSVSRSMDRVTEHRMSLLGAYDETDSFVDYQTRMVGVAKEIARLATDMTGKAATDAGRLAPLAGELTHKYGQLAQDSVGAAATTANSDIAHRIRTAVVECGEGVTRLIKSAGQCQLSPDSAAQRAVADSAKNLNEKVGSVLAALQAGSRGTQACIDAAATVSAIIGDLDTTILFASAGTLHAENESDTFSERREGILQTAKTLVEDTKTLVGGAAGSQEQLADAAQCAVTTIVQLAEIVKLGAMALGSHNPDSQVLLIHAVRDVAAALRDLIHTTKDASGKHIGHPHMARLKDSAKRLVDATKRWSLPTPKASTLPRQRRRRSAHINRFDTNSCDSETDLFVSDQEDELLKLLDYSSQDDEVSPSVFQVACADVQNVVRRIRTEVDAKKEDCYERASRNSLVDMEWRVMKYGENILIGEIKKLIDVTEELASREVNRKKRDKVLRQRANSDLDNEMKRLSQVIEELDVDENVHEINTRTITTIQTNIKKPKVEEKPHKLKIKNTTFKVKKVRPINLVINLDVQQKPAAERASVSPVKSPEKSPVKSKKDEEIESHKGEATPVIVQPDTVEIKRNEFWKMFTTETELWKALALKNLQKNEETRRELERFSGHELVIGDYQNEINKYEEEKNTLQGFIEDVELSKNVNKTLEYDEKYEEIVLKLIEFAKKDFIFKGFDPLIGQLHELSNLKIQPRKKKIVNITDVHNIYNTIDVTKYTYEELCRMEKYYKEIVRKYNRDNKENSVPRDDRSPSVETDSEPQKQRSYHRNVILNVQTSHNKSKNIHQYKKNIDQNNESKSQSHSNIRNQEIYDLTRTYPAEYYANNWWKIYEDILKTREQQFGSIDNWWNFYEAILKKEVTNEEELNRIRAVVEYRNSLRQNSRNSSRMEEQLRMLDEIKNDIFQETEEVKTDERDALDQSVMVTNVTSLLKTVKAVEDEHTRGTRALESTIEAISQEIRVLESPGAPRAAATPEELLRATRQMTAATARAVAAGNSARQDDVTAAANVGRKAVSDMLAACKGAAYGAETEALRARTLGAGRAAAESYRELLRAALASVQGTAAARQQFPELSRRVAHAVADVMAAAELLKGSDWVDPDDPTVIAENELLGAAASIDAAANKLAALRPRKNTTKETDETLNFDEMILEAAKSIIAATSALVRAASAAQRELIDQGKVARRPTFSSDDGQWSEGLISAARMVAAAAHSLVEAANALVQGLGSEEKLISSAKQVASSTAHLLVACKVKADPSSESTRRLQGAGAEVIRSTDNLVRAARDAISSEEERCLVLNRRMVGGIAQEIDARSEVLRIERELEEARGRLTAIRQAKYKLKGDTSGDETDHDYSYQRDGYTSDSSGHRFSKPSFAPANNSSFGPANTTYSPNSTFGQNNSSFGPANASFGQNTTNYSQNTTNLSQNTTNLSQNTTNLSQNTTNLSHNIHQQNQSLYGTPNYGQTNGSYTAQALKSPVEAPKSTSVTNVEKTTYSVQSPSFSSFRAPSAGETTPKQNYEGFTTRSMTVRDEGEGQTTRTVVVTSGTLEEVRTVETEVTQSTERITYKREPKPPPPPRRGLVTLQLPNVTTTKQERDKSHYETRLYDTPRAPAPPPPTYLKSEESHFTSQHYANEHKFGYDVPKSVPSPLSPKFNARYDLKFDQKSPDPIYSTINKTDGIRDHFTETQKSTENIPGGKIESEYTVKSESYQSYPTTEFSKVESRQVNSPFGTSTPSKFAKTDLSSEYKTSDFSKNMTSTDLVKAVTPDFSKERISSPYGKEMYSYGAPNFTEETSTEVKEIPNGTQRITTTKIYSSSPVTISSTNTKYDSVKPVKLEGLDELSKSFDNDSRFSTLDSRYDTLDSRFNTINSKMSSDTSRSFMRPSDFQQSEYQATSNVSKVVQKPSALAKELDTIDRKTSKQTVSKETVERKTVMTSSHKTESSSTVTKKFGNF